MKIPSSKKPYVGLRLADGINNGIEIASKQMSMSKSEFVRYCILQKLEDLSLFSQQVKEREK